MNENKIKNKEVMGIIIVVNYFIWVGIDY
jgi:hypothetical protein